MSSQTGKQLLPELKGKQAGRATTDEDRPKRDARTVGGLGVHSEGAEFG